MPLAARRVRRRQAEGKASEAGIAQVGSAAGGSTTHVRGATPAYEPLFVGPDTLSRNVSFASRPAAQDTGEQALLGLIRSSLGPRAAALAIRRMNRTPVKAGCQFSYIIRQGAEEADLLAVEREMTSGRLYRSGLVLQGGAWSRMLLGPRFAVGASRKQVHELTFRRSSCTCLACLVDAARTGPQVVNAVPAFLAAADPRADRKPNFHYYDDVEGADGFGRDAQTISDDGRHPCRGPSKVRRSGDATPASPEFPAPRRKLLVQQMPLPSVQEMERLGADVCAGELRLGELHRLNSRTSAKLNLDDSVKTMLDGRAYVGPAGSAQLPSKIVTMGVDHYRLNEGKKSRKVYVRGDLVTLRVNVGVVNVPCRPLHLDEVGCRYILHARQTMLLYFGTIQLEGNTIGSYVDTGVQLYVGFGAEGGAAAIHPHGRPMGAPRRLGVNELLLHYRHGEDEDLIVQCR